MGKKYTMSDIKDAIALVAQRRPMEALNDLKSLDGYDAARMGRTGTFEWHLAKLERFLTTGTPEYTVYTEGNSKLPFLSFSALAGKDVCPGAGECLEYCYSYTGYRNTCAFTRAFQNTVLLQSEEGRETLTRKLDEVLKKKKFSKADRKMGKKVDFRLYVDGDFSNGQQLAFWMKVLEDRPDLNTYGYSKSLHLFRDFIAEGGTIPTNYVLNLSNGGIYDNMMDSLRKEYFVRGDFVAVHVAHKSSGFDRTKEDRAALNLAIADILGLNKKEVFVCPGLCGKCTAIGHACGNPMLPNGVRPFDNKSIVIPIH